jgi:hypothetical protein
MNMVRGRNVPAPFLSSKPAASIVGLFAIEFVSLIRTWMAQQLDMRVFRLSLSSNEDELEL